ncbi:MAG: hypothetical protein IPL32_00140 [Chloracidobacterium sp.]|nr:hypothetical protein [Chloracidobacterium sp.]
MRKVEFNDQQIDKGYCEIRIKGKLEPSWTEWFDLMSISSETDVTVISGLVSDQAALQGLIEKISFLGMTIISISFKKIGN